MFRVFLSFFVMAALATTLATTLSCELIIDSDSDGDNDNPDGPPVVGQCCEIQTPTCDCFQTGGVANEFGCPVVCDAEPDGWVLDEGGTCPELIFVGGTGSCFAVEDAGVPDAVPQVDAALSTDAGPDASL